MSELKAFNMPRYAGEFTTHKVYLKDEVDKVLEAKDAEIRRLKHALWVTRAAMAKFEKDR